MEDEPDDEPVDDLDEWARDLATAGPPIEHKRYFHPSHRLSLDDSLYVLALPDLMSCYWLPLRESGSSQIPKYDPARWHLNDAGDIFFLVRGEFCFRLDNAIAGKFRHLMNARKFDPKYVNVLDDANALFDWQLSLACCVGRSLGYFYLIQSDRYYKIGIAQDMTQRYRRYVTESPHENKIIFATYCHGNDQVEKLVKERYRDKLHRGEWFSFDTDDVEKLIDVSMLIAHRITSVDRNGKDKDVQNWTWLELDHQDLPTRGKTYCW